MGARTKSDEASDETSAGVSLRGFVRGALRLYPTDDEIILGERPLKRPWTDGASVRLARRSCVRWMLLPSGRQPSEPCIGPRRPPSEPHSGGARVRPVRPDRGHFLWSKSERPSISPPGRLSGTWSPRCPLCRVPSPSGALSLGYTLHLPRRPSEVSPAGASRADVTFICGPAPLACTPSASARPVCYPFG